MCVHLVQCDYRESVVIQDSLMSTLDDKREDIETAEVSGERDLVRKTWEESEGLSLENEVNNLFGQANSLPRLLCVRFLGGFGWIACG